MTQFLDVFGFLSVLLRGLALGLEALVLGGLAFRWRVARDAPAGHRMLRWAALALALVETAYILANSAVLVGTTDLAWSSIWGASYFQAGCVVTGASLLLVALNIGERRRADVLQTLLGLVIVAAVVFTSHSAARVRNQGLLMVLTGLHHVGAGAWIGGLPHLLVNLRIAGVGVAKQMVARFSTLAMTSVATLTVAGLGLSFAYIDSPQAIYGTSYGLMVAGKVVLLIVILVLGAGNYFLVRHIAREPERMLTRLRRFAEAEIGLGFTAVLAAASLTSMPPAMDLPQGRATAQEVIERLTPRTPRFSSPSISELSPVPPISFHADTRPGELAPASFVPGQKDIPLNAADIAWSEYNHHWAGIIVLAAGLLAVGARKWKFCRHWPLVFLGLGAFLFLRSDPENWPLGHRGFWESMTVGEVLEHRLAVLLVLGFAWFEWRVQTNRVPPQPAGLVFPCACVLGGVLLLTHSHSLTNYKESLLIEWSHLPLGLVAAVGGWARWLEIRSEGWHLKIVTWIWPMALTMIGLVLVIYREA